MARPTPRRVKQRTAVAASRRRAEDTHRADRVRLRRLLFATDFSECSRDALTHATYLASELQAELVLIHVVERPFFLEVGVSHRLRLRRDMDRLIHESKSEAQQRLEAMAVGLRTRGLTATTCCRQGIPSAEIIQAAEEARADLIVVGTHGRSGLSHALIGSVAERVVQRAPCAVLAVRPARPPTGRPVGEA